MKKRILFLFAPIFLLVSCTKWTVEINIPLDDSPKFYNQNPISYGDLAVGQKSIFVLLEGRQYYNDTIFDDFNYLNDTLVAEIISQDENGFLVEEHLTPGSDSLSLNFYQIQDVTYQYYLKVDNNVLKITYPDSEIYTFSSLLFWRLPDSLDLTPFTNQEADITGWKTTLPYCECNQTGYILYTELLGQIYEDLNISIRDQIMASDGPGTTYIYSAQYGMVKSMHYGLLSQTGLSWDLLGKKPPYEPGRIRDLTP